MATYIGNHYDQNHALYKRFNELIPKNSVINHWYFIGNHAYVYVNSKGYYHLSELKKTKTHYYFKDSVLNSNMELKFSSEIGYFKSLIEVSDFIMTKTN